MRDPLLRSFSSFPRSSQDSWLHRVRDNFRELLMPDRAFPSLANGAPIHVLKLDPSLRRSRAQSFSLLTHAAIIAAFVLLAARPPVRLPNQILTGSPAFHPIPSPRGLLDRLRSLHPSDGRGAGGDQNPIPATRGNLPPRSLIQLVKPSLPPKQETQVPVPPTIFDPKAAPVLAPTDHIGLPWMKDFTDSPGPGIGHTIGSSVGNTLGDSTDGPGGHGISESPYQPGMIFPKCAYCPYPTYTDEARQAKVQGNVTMQVLVGTDGRASQIRVVKGIGMGLDDRAIEAVRAWRFVPAQDASRHPISYWVTIEAVFRLF